MKGASSEHSEGMKRFQQIYRQEIAYVWKCLRRLGVDEKNIEDKAHDVFVIFYKRQRDFDPARPVRPWLSGIAARVALDHNRLAYQSREVLQDTTSSTASPVLNPEELLQHRDAQRILLAALDRLDIDQRTVFVLHDIEGRSIPEIAEVVDAPINTLYSRLRLARQQMNASLRSGRRKRCGT